MNQPDTDYVVLVRVRGGEPLDGTVARALRDGYGEDWIKGFLASKLPAGSPLEIRSVHEASA